MQTLTVIRGASGSGKTTLAKAMANTYGARYVEADMFFTSQGKYSFDFKKLKDAHAWCKKTVENEMLDGLDVIVSNTFTKLWEMQPYLDMAKQYGYSVQVIHCQGRFKNVHGVPEEKVQQMRDNFEPYFAE